MADNPLRELWQQAVNGDKQAEDEIFRHLSERFEVIAGLSICKEDARDIAHDACLIVLKGYKSLGNPYEYSAWAQKILKNKIADYFQRKSLQNKVFVGSDIYDRAVTNPDNGPDFETLETLRRCLKKLASAFPKYARAIHLRHIGYDTDSICEEMRLTKSNLYVLLNRGRSFLRKCILEGKTK